MVTRLSDKYTISRVGRSGRTFSVIRTPMWSASNSALEIVHSLIEMLSTLDELVKFWIDFCSTMETQHETFPVDG